MKIIVTILIASLGYWIFTITNEKKDIEKTLLTYEKQHKILKETLFKTDKNLNSVTKKLKAEEKKSLEYQKKIKLLEKSLQDNTNDNKINLNLPKIKDKLKLVLQDIKKDFTNLIKDDKKTKIPSITHNEKIIKDSNINISPKIIFDDEKNVEKVNIKLDTKF